MIGDHASHSDDYFFTTPTATEKQQANPMIELGYVALSGGPAPSSHQTYAQRPTSLKITTSEHLVSSSVRLSSTTTRLPLSAAASQQDRSGVSCVLIMVAVYKRKLMFMCLFLHHMTSADISSLSPHPHNPTSLPPALLTRRPQPFRLTLASPWMTNTAQAPHQFSQRHLPIPPINGMPLSSQREPHKRP